MWKGRSAPSGLSVRKRLGGGEGGERKIEALRYMWEIKRLCGRQLDLFWCLKL